MNILGSHQFIFMYPLWLIVIPLVFLWQIIMWQKKKSQRVNFSYSSLALLSARVLESGLWRPYVGTWLHMLTLLCLIVALARPQEIKSEHRAEEEGVDIILALDTSNSMNALDFEQKGSRTTRIAVAKGVLADFVAKRSDDRLGLVVFGEYAFTQTPLTYDHDILGFYLDHLEAGMAGNSTAIGDGLAMAVKRIKEIDAKEKIIILLTDGENNAGKVSPEDAVMAAQEFGIKVYTIAMGRNGVVPIRDNLGMIRQVQVTVDEKLLQDIAAKTGAAFFKADTTENLSEVYQKIDELEKTKRETTYIREVEEWFFPFALASLVFCLLGFVFDASLWRRIPA